MPINQANINVQDGRVLAAWQKFLLPVILTLGVCFSLTTHARVYVYSTPSGGSLITDSKISKPGYRLKRSYATTPYRSGGRNKPYYAKPIKSQYDALIVNTSLKYNLEPSFVKAVVHIESAFDPNATSKAGALGLMQLMPATAASYQLERNHFDPIKNVEVGVRHLRDLMDRYGSDKKLTLAAYNAGQGAVAKYEGVPPYDETQNYITKVMRLYDLYKDQI